MNGSITSCGKPCGYVGNACAVTTPISSQWPVVVSLPFERSTSRPATAGAPGCGGQPSSGSTFPRPSASMFGRSRPPTAFATFASVFEPSSPYSVGVRQRAGADGVEHDHAGPAVPRSWPPGYSRFGMDNVLGLLAFVVYIAVVIAVAAGVTWLVVRLTPAKKPKAAGAEPSA